MKRMLRRLCAICFVFSLCITSASALTVEQAIDLLEEYYIDELPASAYEAETLDDLFKAIGDPYTYYMSAKDYDAFTSGVESETSVTGIGAGIEYTAEGIRITSVLSDGSAEAAGLVPGDIIIAIEGTPCVPGEESHRELILGEEGTFVNITILHADGTTEDYHLERRVITIRNTTVTIEDGVGYIDCDSFGTQTGEYFYQGVSENEDTRLWVVDLRNNVGGLADSAATALGLFTGFGPKLYYRTSDGTNYQTLFLADRLTETPVIVTVNNWTASASEILSGGIRADAAGIIIGSRTYGKGVAQIVLDKSNHPDLFDGDSLKVTVYRFYCSDGNTTDKIGVIPTLFVADEYVSDIVRLLCNGTPESGDAIRFSLNGSDYYVNLDQARSEEYRAAFAELLSALPPDVPVYCNIDGVEAPMDSALAAEHYNIDASFRSFSDVKSSPFATQINTLGAYGILNGVGEGRFDPNRTLTRAELCAMLAQALNVTNNAGSFFTDVTEDHWYYGDVTAMASLGFVNGIGDGRFDPMATLTQEQFIAVMGRLTTFLNFKADDFVRSLSDGDLPQFSSLRSWVRPGALVLTGYADENMLYAPLEDIELSSAVTREQAAATLCNILKTLNILSY